MKPPRWITDAYKETEIHWSRTQAEIHQRLGQLGIHEVRFTNLRDKFALEFVLKVSESEKPRAVRIIIKLAYTGDDEKKRTKELNTVHRVLLNHLRAKFIAIGTGLTEFEEEFMAHLVVSTANGNSTTLGQTLLPQYRQATENGENPEFKLLGGNN